jgi:hypothetical protein
MQADNELQPEPEDQSRNGLSTASRSQSTCPVGGHFGRSPRDSPRRKYFDSGDYELARAGIVDAASVGSIHASPERLATSRWSASSQQLHPEIIASHSTVHSSNSPIKQSFSAASFDESSILLLSSSAKPHDLPASIPEGDRMQD